MKPEDTGPKVIETPYGTITLLPITEEDMETMKKSLIQTLKEK